MSGDLKVLQINVNRSSATTESCLQLAIEKKIDLLLIQEPWIISKELDFIDARSIIHSSFYSFLPKPSGLRPRVLIYSSRFTQLDIAISPKSPRDSDILVIVCLFVCLFVSSIRVLYKS